MLCTGHLTRYRTVDTGQIIVYDFDGRNTDRLQAEQRAWAVKSCTVRVRHATWVQIYTPNNCTGPYTVQTENHLHGGKHSTPGVLQGTTGYYHTTVVLV